MNTLRLLPHIYKRIGLMISAITSVLLLLPLFTVDLFYSDLAYVEFGLKTVLLISLLMMVFARDKKESDELNLIRYDKLKRSLLFVAGWFIIESLLDTFILEKNQSSISGYEMLIILLLFYLVIYNFRQMNT